MSEVGRGGRFTNGIARLAVRRPGAILVVTALLLSLSLWRITKLRLDTDFAQLLPERDPSVVVLHEMNRRMAALSSLDVVVQGPDGAANRRFVEALATRLRALGDPLIDEVAVSVRAEREFFDHNRALYASLDELSSARDRLQREIGARKNPFLTDLDALDSGAQREGLADIRRSIEARGNPFARFPSGYYAYADGSLFAVVVWLRSGFLGSGPGTATADRIRAATRALLAEQGNPGQRAGLTGNIITAAEERDALANDLVLATTISVALVCLAVFAFFGRVRAVLFMVVPAACGVLVALAFAQAAFGFLNTATGFMGSIIVGNGINYAIVQMARYEEERRAGRAVPEAIAVALATTWRATGLAALSAAVAYGSLVVTDFRGFNQFGYIGAVGMLLAWAATLLVLPAVWAVGDRRSSSTMAAASRRRVLRGFEAAAPIARFVLARPRAILAAGAVLTVIAIAPLPRYLADPFEYDFDKLRNQVSKRSESETLSTKLNPIFGRSLSPSFVLADEPGQAERIRDKLLAADPERHVLGSVKTVFDFLPGAVDAQRQKLEVIASIRALLDRNLDLLDDKDRAEARALRPPDDLRPLVPADLPAGIRRFYTEIDGTIGRPVAYFPREDVNVWDGRVQLQLAAIVREVRLDDGTRVRSSGWAVIFAAMIAAVVHQGPLVTAVSFAAVVLLVVGLARGVGAWLIVGSLCLGVVWMLGGVAAAGVRLNFLNFIALPITFGIAADYGANIFLRYKQEGRDGLARAVSATGGAVALCSLTTIIGYGALLVADTEGLRTFGAAAILGEVACLTTAIAILPAAIAVLDARKDRRARSPSTEVA